MTTAAERDRLAEDRGYYVAPVSRGVNDPKPVQLWDVIDQQWSAPLPLYMRERHLQKKVFACTAVGCRETSVRTGLIASHIARVSEMASAHKDAQIHETPSPGGGFNLVCTGCAASFKSRLPADRHIKEVAQAGPNHTVAGEILMNRFTIDQQHMERRVPVVAAAGPVEGAAPRPRRRRRRRSRRVVA